MVICRGVKGRIDTKLLFLRTLFTGERWLPSQLLSRKSFRRVLPLYYLDLSRQSLMSFLQWKKRLMVILVLLWWSMFREHRNRYFRMGLGIFSLVVIGAFVFEVLGVERDLLLLLIPLSFGAIAIFLMLLFAVSGPGPGFRELLRWKNSGKKIRLEDALEHERKNVRRIARFLLEEMKDEGREGEDRTGEDDLMVVPVEDDLMVVPMEDDLMAVPVEDDPVREPAEDDSPSKPVDGEGWE